MTGSRHHRTGKNLRGVFFSSLFHPLRSLRLTRAVPEKSKPMSRGSSYSRRIAPESRRTLSAPAHRPIHRCARLVVGGCRRMDDRSSFIAALLLDGTGSCFLTCGEFFCRDQNAAVVSTKHADAYLPILGDQFAGRTCWIEHHLSQGFSPYGSTDRAEGLNRGLEPNETGCLLRR